jgi:hypothetical protein
MSQSGGAVPWRLSAVSTALELQHRSRRQLHALLGGCRPDFVLVFL